MLSSRSPAYQFEAAHQDKDDAPRNGGSRSATSRRRPAWVNVLARTRARQRTEDSARAHTHTATADDHHHHADGDGGAAARIEPLSSNRLRLTGGDCGGGDDDNHNAIGVYLTQQPCITHTWNRMLVQEEEEGARSSH